MKRRISFSGRISAMLCALLLLSSCSAATQEADELTFADIPADFTVQYAAPMALVDQQGYRTGSVKSVVFRGTLPDNTFEIRRTLDDEVVFTGNARPARGDDTVCIGTFSEFQTEGQYYIYTTETGSSYAFAIGEDFAGHRLEEALWLFYLRRCGTEISEAEDKKGARAACHLTNARLQEDPTLEIPATGGWHTDESSGRDVILTCDALRDLLLSMEINAGSFSDDLGIPESGNGVADVLDEARYAMEWLFLMQRSDGGVYGGILTGGNENSANLTLTNVTAEATIRFAADAARMSYLYRSLDADFSREALTRAEEAWSYYIGERTPLQERAAFSAAAELYRMTGERKYEAVLSAFFSREDFSILFEEDDDIFYGCITYMATNQPVNVAVCDAIMENLLLVSEKIVQRASDSAYQVSESDVDLLLRDMCRLSVTNHIIYNHEYIGIMENHVHYLCGRNPDAIDYVGEDSEYTWMDAGVQGIYSSVKLGARFILLLAAIS